MNKEQIQEQITTGQAALGVEFGSTRIKAVLVATDSSVIAVGSHNWENKLENGVWTYSLKMSIRSTKCVQEFNRCRC